RLAAGLCGDSDGLLGGDHFGTSGVNRKTGDRHDQQATQAFLCQVHVIRTVLHPDYSRWYCAAERYTTQARAGLVPEEEPDELNHPQAAVAGCRRVGHDLVRSRRPASTRVSTS